MRPGTTLPLQLSERRLSETGTNCAATVLLIEHTQVNVIQYFTEKQQKHYLEKCNSNISDRHNDNV